MNRPMDLSRRQQAALVCLLWIAMASPIFLAGPALLARLPDCLAGAVGLGALLGVLLIFRTSGALRTRFLARNPMPFTSVPAFIVIPSEARDLLFTSRFLTSFGMTEINIPAASRGYCQVKIPPQAAGNEPKEIQERPTRTASAVRQLRLHTALRRGTSCFSHDVNSWPPPSRWAPSTCSRATCSRLSSPKLRRFPGRARVAACIRSLNEQCKAGLAADPKVKLHTPMSGDLSAGLVVFEVAGLAPAEMVKRLLAKRIIASTSPYAITYARLAPSLVNTPEQVDQAIRAVREISG